MTEHNDHKLSDEELDDLITGKHPVSGAYRDLDQPVPPADLDARILARARASVTDESSGRRDVFIRPYATAAMVLVCLGISFMLLNEPAPTPAEKRSEGQVIRRVIPVTTEQDEQAPRAALQRELAGDDDALLFSAGAADSVADQAVEEVAQSNSNAAGNAGAAASGAAPQSLQNLVDQRRLSTVNAGPQPPQAQSGEVTRAPPEARSSQTLGRSDSLEEVVVTGSRLRETQQGYREARETWLVEIARLRDAGAEDAAAVEAALFLERYPDTDIEAALDALDTP